MLSGSDDVRRRTAESSAQSHRGGKTVSRGLLRTIQQTKGQGNPLEISGVATLRIPSTWILKRNERYASIKEKLYLL
ncbi:unnamed protein product [Protopolystoma xenopodis]|uniref:Uncharacterized protein n=1 Tax=Protopolystoma xenopodis TaxID=117903 RepID=A0A3S5CUN1_9PLAT|nr:unnamed protein product [Protopolystoma xenopodis]